MLIYNLLKLVVSLKIFMDNSISISQLFHFLIPAALGASGAQIHPCSQLLRSPLWLFHKVCAGPTRRREGEALDQGSCVCLFLPPSLGPCPGAGRALLGYYICSNSETCGQLTCLEDNPSPWGQQLLSFFCLRPQEQL